MAVFEKLNFSKSKFQGSKIEKLAPMTGLMVAVGAAITLDTFFGIYRSVKVKGWKFVTSRRLSEIISKMLFVSDVHYMSLRDRFFYPN